MAIIEKNNTFYMSESAGIRHDFIREWFEPYPAHHHDFIEFIYIFRGNCVHTIDGNEYPVKRGDLLIVNYNQLHSFSGYCEAEFFNIFLKPEYISASLAAQENAFALLNLSEFTDFRKTLDETIRMVSFTGRERDTVETAITNLEAELNHTQPGYALSAKSWLNLLLVMIFRKMSLLIAETFSGISDELLVYMKAHCSDKLTVSELARRCHYNPSYFSRRFKAFTGETFVAYLKKLRIERAEYLLESTSMKIADICTEVGYTDKTQFYRDFRKQFGVTPLEKRKGKK